MVYHANHAWLQRRVPRRRGVLRDQRLPDHAAADRRARAQRHGRARAVLAAPRPAAAAGAVRDDRRGRRSTWRCSTGDRRASRAATSSAALFYGSNWYQICVGQGYTATEAFAPLRHLWSLAVEEQFYLIWPLVMVGRAARSAATGCPRSAVWLFGIAVADRRRRRRCSTCPATSRRRAPGAGSRLLAGRRPLHQHQRRAVPGTFSRASGLLLGAAFAMVWRPVAIMRGPMRDKGRAARPRRRRRPGRSSASLMWQLSCRRSAPTRRRFDPWLFRGGFFAHRPGHAVRDRRRHPPRRVAGTAARQPGAATGSARAATACTCTTGRSTRSSARRPGCR